MGHHVTLATPLLGALCQPKLGLDIMYLCAKFNDSSLSRSTDAVGALQNLSRSSDLTTPLSGMICHPWASTYYDQSIYLIRNLYLHLLQRYER